MNKQQALKWCIDNLPRWPEASFPDTKPEGWKWIGTMDETTETGLRVFLCKDKTGEIVTSREFYRGRSHDCFRLQSCGMSFNELMEDLDK